MQAGEGFVGRTSVHAHMKDRTAPRWRKMVECVVQLSLIVAALLIALGGGGGAIAAAHSPPRTSPIIATAKMTVDGNIIVDDVQHRFFVLSDAQIPEYDSRTGRPLRTMDAYKDWPDEPVTAELALDRQHGILVLGDDDGNIVFIDILAGRVRFQTNVAAIVNDVAIDEGSGQAYIALSSGWGKDQRPRLIALSLATGALRAQYTFAADREPEWFWLDNGIGRLAVTVEQWDGPLYKQTLRDSTLLLLDTQRLHTVAQWSCRKHCENGTLDAVHHTLVLSYRDTHRLELRDLRQGHLLWRITAAEGRATVVANHVFFASGMSLDMLDEQTGRVLARIRLPNPAFNLLSAPTARTVVVQTEPQHWQTGQPAFMLLDSQTGLRTATLKIPRAIVGGAVFSPISHRLIVVSDVPTPGRITADDLLILALDSPGQ